MVLMPHERGLRFWLAVLLTAILLVGVLQPSPVYGAGGGKKKDLEDIRDKKGKVQDELNKLRKKIAKPKKEVTKIEKDIEKTNRLIADVEKQQKENKKKRDYYEGLFKDRFRVIFQNGDMGNMRTLLQSGSITEFFERFQTLRLILARDQTLMNQFLKVENEKKKLVSKYKGLADKQQKQAEKARKIYVSVQKDIDEAKKKLSKISDKEDSIKEALQRLTLVDASLYPFKYASTSGVDAWGFYNRQCTSFVAWRMNQHGKKFSNMMRGGRWGDATNWDNNASNLGYSVNRTPKVGAIAQWDAGDNASRFGHVAFVKEVKGSKITIEEYNYNPRYGFSTRTIPASSVGNFIHFY
ncbi:CHAP domain-containing protein [Marininema mesophilum]|uniref:CHAP domain-containing protein n=1 Tax=Marininema mesophilum TaxID=1048340 RepID=A0A1H2TR88_9BACL|nr:CHAP domain-containing protein [Marininema mesophilum]SDW46436.1 CHAP domain-containing protein [Marininema mesophilum]